MVARFSFWAMKRRSVLLVLAFVVALGETSAAPVSAHAANPNVVITWNGIMMATFATAVVPPPAAIRLGAIVQASVFDAVNGIDPQYTAVHVAPAGPAGASRQAAAAAAAHTALVSLFPLQQSALDAQFASSLAAMRGDEGASSRIAAGIAWGNSVAGQTLAWRAADGFSTVLPYTQGSAPGDWAPTPGGSGPPKFQSLSITVPFAMTSPSEFRPAGPPALTSARYTADFKEVKAYGSATSAVRSTFQTETATFWQADTPVGIWDRVADSLAMANHLNLLRSARLLAMVNLAEADAIIAVFDAKAHFNSWRPVTAVAGAALDGNPDTTTEAGWTPLLTTPYFQEYPSAHSGVSTAATVVLSSFFGNQASFTVTSAGLPGVVRNFRSFSAAVEQVADARIYAGFHFRFSTEDATQMGTRIGRLTDSTLMQRIRDEEE
ncbi:MAG: large repetitive protein [Chloroflexota bacterium]|nr:large repetitive protein [Chloroflexota bacterium]